MSIAEYIPHGRKNAISKQKLCAITGLNERIVRLEISKARRDTVILNMQDGKGYFIPTEEEHALVERWYRQEKSRLKEHALSLKAAGEVTKDYEGQLCIIPGDE